MSHLYIAFDPSDVDALFELHEVLRKANIPDAFRSATADTPLPKIDDMERLAEANAVVMLASSASLRSKVVRQEIELAHKLGKPLFIAFLDNEKPQLRWSALLADAQEFDFATHKTKAMNDFAAEARKIYETKCPIVSIMNLKGGVGKTTISSQVFGYLQKARNNRILLIDFDPQFNLTQFFLTQDEADTRIEKDQSVLAMFEPSQITSAIHPSPALDWTTFNNGIFTPPPTSKIVRHLLPKDKLSGALDLITGQFELTKYAFLENSKYLNTAEGNLKQTIDLYRKDYDLIVIDTNPSASFLTRVTLGVTDHIIAPILPNPFSLRGLRLLEMILQRFCPNAERPGVSVLFNGVPKSQQNTFETDARDGAYNNEVAFSLSEALLTNTLYQSSYLDLKTSQVEDEPLNRLAAYSAKGPFATDLKRRLGMISEEIMEKVSGPAV